MDRHCPVHYSVAAKPEPSPVKPLRDITQDELRIVLREWERKMKANILAKTEAIAEAQSQVCGAAEPLG